ncbi:ATP-binding protein [Deferribacter autotrophicus]|uniref:ATP-binding protein n=1 Tax=Deferribacter autotrophicus TaxID=500465 RepID=A0A5A8F536_9BACT|nr:ATP-binding protein [Deferribacter autotrophicus]KAA0258606.1 ATP-binding protein [Deferribacter autotrophicus]
MQPNLLANVSIQSDLNLLQETIIYITTILKKKNIYKTPEEYFYLELVLSELVSNAIIHGNNNDKNKTVDITVHLHNNILIIEVSDEGEIFDIKLPEKLNPLTECGKGLYLVKQLVDELYIKKDERKKVIIKKNIKNSKPPIKNCN